MKVYTAEQMREHERLAVERGTSYRQLMENAGSAAAQTLSVRRCAPSRRSTTYPATRPHHEPPNYGKSLVR